MNLLAPAALALAAVAVPIVAMYILKMRRPPRVVPSTFLWQQALYDVQANAPWQRLRPNLLLLLQLLAVAALVLALARPYVLRAAVAQGDVVAVLDGSALMTATDVAPSRFAAARARISTLIDGLGANDVMSIVLMARHAHVLIAQSADRAALHAALDRATPTDETPDPAAALAVAAALARSGRHASIFVYAAAGDPAPAPPSGLPIDTHVITLGGRLRDLGIVAFSATRSADGTVAVLARVANLGRRAATSDLQLDIATVGSSTIGSSGSLGSLGSSGGTGPPGTQEPRNPGTQALTWHTQVDLRPIALSPGGSTVVVRARLPGDTVAARARLLAADDLAADDAAWAAVPTPAPRRVLLVTPGNTFLRLALGLAPGVRVDAVAPEAYGPGSARGADLVVFDGTLPRLLPPTAILAVGPPFDPHTRGGAPLPLAVARPIAGAGVQVDEDPYGLVPGYAVDGVAVNQATPLGVPPWAYAVLRTRGQPVLVVGQRGAQRIAVLGFQLFNSNWVLLPGFPIVVQNLLNWLAPPLSGPAGIYRPGDVVSLVAAPNATALRVIDPAGHSVRLAPPFPAQPFAGTSQPGLYTVEQQTPAGLRRALFAVNALPVSSSGSAGSSGSPGSPGGRQPGNPGTQVPLELAPLVAALALIVLAGEWWVAARRR